MSDPSPVRDYRSLLKRALVEIRGLRERLGALERDRTEPVALIGIGCRFPGSANSPAGLWRVLRAGVDAVGEMDGGRWDVDAYYDPDPEAPGKAYTRRAALIDAVDRFDAPFFGISPREAAQMDPQQRLLLEVAWEALEHACVAPDRLLGSRTAVFVGIGSDDYLQLGLHLGHAAEIDAYASLGSARSIAAGRIAHVLGLRGPVVQVDTSCSSSLVAVHLACQSLRRGECDVALAGGVHLILSPLNAIMRSKVRAVSPDGRSRAFDAAANGFGQGEGCGIVVLKRLGLAEADGDRIIALVRGSAVNHDGRSGGLTVPSQSAQEDVIREALRDAGVRPDEVGYIEAHGTGTSLGDPVEIAALNAVFGGTHTPEDPLLVGSVKTNFGHLEAAAGVVALAKVAMALEQRDIPPHLHFREPNPRIDWGCVPVAIPTTLRPWPTSDRRRVAGVSSFGMSGTNAHLVVEEAPAPRAAPTAVERPCHILALSAKTPVALSELARRFADDFAVTEGGTLADRCFSANTGRALFAHRLALGCGTLDEARAALLAFADAGRARGVRQGVIEPGAAAPRVAFLFGGDLPRCGEPARELYDSQPAFRRAMALCESHARSVAGASVIEPLLALPVPAGAAGRVASEVVLFSLHYALLEMWRSWGVHPAIAMGNGPGEYAATVADGVIGVEEGLRLAAGHAPLPSVPPQIGLLPAARIDALRGYDMLVEVGTGGTMPDAVPELPCVGRLPAERSWWPTLVDSLAALFVRGVSVDWAGFERDYVRRKVSLPTYPFQQQRLWSAAVAAELGHRSTAAGDPLAPATGPTSTITQSLRALIGELLQLDPADVDSRQPLLELGADSLVLVELIRRVQERYGVKLTVRQLFENLLTIDALVEHITRQSLASVSPVSESPAPVPPTGSALPPGVTPASVRPASVPATSAPREPPRQNKRQALVVPPDAEDSARRPLTDTQRRYLDAFIERYQARTRGSRAHAERFGRAVCSSRRMFAAQHPELRPLQYPIIGERSDGSRLWDADGNEYVDLAMGFGVHLFGHNPPFVVQALACQLTRGMQLGPECDLVGEVAELICELTGFDRVTFCNSGTEAVMTALRIARTATGRDKIAMFKNAYHGHFDGTMVVPAEGAEAGLTAPMSPGTPRSLTEDTLLLPYDHPAAFELVERHAASLAAVLVEPVQNRRPDVQPREFLHRLRELTRRHGILLIFDEVLIGFRIAGGAQAWFGVEADMATYAKVLAAGLPIGVVAGRAYAMDRVDGGAEPPAGAAPLETAYTAGTFARNPMSLAAARAVLRELRARGPHLQEELNRLTGRLSRELNSCFEAEGVPLRMTSFGSFFRFSSAGNLSFVYQPLEAALFFYHLIEQGVYVWEGRTCFLSAAHTDADLVRVVSATRTAVRQMKDGGFWPEAARRAALAAPRPAYGGRTPSLSLHFFGDYQADFTPDKYQLLFDAARFADEEGLEAVWVPERHFHSLGGFSPNPAVLASALARETRRIDIRGGSVVLPLHHAIRVAEEWALVDNLSNGRAGVSFASGWHPDDFVLAPSAFERRRDLTFEGVEMVRRLWRGEEITAVGGAGNEVRLRVFPLPARPNIPVWLTTLGNPETYVRAGELGTRVLTNLINQSVDDLGERIRLYRDAYKRAGHDPAGARVTVLAHTFVGDDREQVRAQAKEPFCSYLSSSVDLLQKSADSLGLGVDFGRLPPDDRRLLLERAYDRYASERALIGTPDSCRAIVEALGRAGVDEISCFVDFGLDRETVLAHLPHLLALRPLPTPDRPTAAAAAPSPRSSEVAPEAEGVPTTEEQKLLWLLCQLGDDGSAAYNLRTTIRLEGELDLGVLERAVSLLVARHESLRTTFSSDGAQQHIHASVEVPVRVEDFSRTDPALLETIIERWFEVDAVRVFDLERGPLLRVDVLRLAQSLHLLVVTAHHAVCDGWSKWVLLDELGTMYTALRRGAEVPLPPPVQFRQLCEARRAAERPNDADHERFWLEQFGTAASGRSTRGNGGPTHLPRLELPTDRPRAVLKTYRGERLPLRLDAPLIGAIRSFSREQGTTPFMTVLAAYLAFLHRLSGQDDLVVGVPASARAIRGSERVVGLVANLLPLRSLTSGDTRFEAHLQSVKRLVLSAFEHESYSFARLIDRLGVRRDGRSSPLVSVTFNWDRVVVPEYDGLHVTLTPKPVQHARFDLGVNVSDGADDLVLDWEYNRDLFHAATIRSWQRAFQSLLQGALLDRGRAIGQLPLVSPDEARRIVLAARGERRAFPDVCVHQRVEEQAAATPAAIAVRDERRSLSYASLETSADLLARRLRALGVQPGDSVAVRLERSVDLVTSMLAVWKAGAAFVPLDPSFPEERTRLIVDDVEPRAIVSDGGAVPGWRGPMVIAPWDGAAPPDASAATLLPRATPDQRAYVMYTSGSTGQPKGVPVAHRQLANYVDGVLTRLQCPAGAHFLVASSLAVDLGFTALFPALVSGGCLHILSRDAARDPERFAAYCREHPIDCLKITPSHLEALLTVASPETVLPHSQLVLGGETLTWTLVDRLRKIGCRCAIMNHYGPTETTVGVATYAVSAAVERLGCSVPIGRPLPNNDTYVLDGAMQPVPVGWPGILHVGGAQVSRGYHRRPEQTRSLFVPDPFAEQGERIGEPAPTGAPLLYVTGDRARVLADGTIELLGRADDQVKIRGFRVEPGEVEAFVRALPGVRDAAVAARASLGEQLLVAYVVPADAGAFDAAALRRQITARVPEHMVPWPIVAVPEIPRLPGGKVDRKRLPAVEHRSERPYVAPQTPLESQIAGIWQEALNVARIGVDDSFFDLGGDSLLVARVASRLRRLVQLEIPLRVFLEVPSIAGLAEYIETARWALRTVNAPQREPDDERIRVEI